MISLREWVFKYRHMKACRELQRIERKRLAGA